VVDNNHAVRCHLYEDGEPWNAAPPVFRTSSPEAGNQQPKGGNA
jgi:hypothetical protein